MLAVSPLRDTTRDEKQGEVESSTFSINGCGGDGFPDFADSNLLDSIDFDDLFIGINDGDVLPDLEMDPEILAEFSASGSEEFSEVNTSVSVEKPTDDHDIAKKEDKFGTCVVMLAVSPLRDTTRDEKQGEVESSTFSINGCGGDGFPDFADSNLLDSIDFDDLFIGINDGDVLPDLEMDPEILAEFSASGSEEFSEVNTSVSVEKPTDDHDIAKKEDK
ncbi:hypothetical protein TIFTF001_050938, partial [Ficus carica]